MSNSMDPNSLNDVEDIISESDDSLDDDDEEQDEEDSNDDQVHLLILLFTNYCSLHLYFEYLNIQIICNVYI